MKKLRNSGRERSDRGVDLDFAITWFVSSCLAKRSQVIYFASVRKALARLKQKTEAIAASQGTTSMNSLARKRYEEEIRKYRKATVKALFLALKAKEEG